MAVLLLRPLMEVSMVSSIIMGSFILVSKEISTLGLTNGLRVQSSNALIALLLMTSGESCSPELTYSTILSVRHLYCVSVIGYKYMCVPVQGYACTDAGGACAGDKVSV